MYCRPNDHPLDVICWYARQQLRELASMPQSLQPAERRSPLYLRTGHKAKLDRLKSKAGEAERAARSVTANIAKDKIFKSIFAGLEQRTISVRDLEDLLEAFVEDPREAGMSEPGLLLDSGYWFPRDQIVHEGLCQCERNACVGYNKKIYRYLEASLSPWVVTTGLFWRCYDEVIACPRCAGRHKRGHIGRADVCGRPCLNQAAQNDSLGAGGA